MQKYSIFSIPPYHFAYPLADLSEVITNKPLFPVPKAPNFILGLLPLRGQSFTILSLPILLGYTPTQDEHPLTVLLKSQNERFGFQSKRVDVITQVPNLHPSPSGLPFYEWTQGFFHYQDHKVFVLTFAPLFSLLA